MQQDLFSENNNTKPKTTELVISKQGKKALSKNQNEFNKLTSKIEKLQKEIVKKQDRLEVGLNQYAKDLYPLKNILLENRKENLLILWEHYKANRLSKKDQKYLKEIVREKLAKIFDDLSSEPDEKLKEIFNTLENIDFDKMVKQDTADGIKQMQKILKKAKVDLSDIDINNEEDLYKKIFELNENLHERDRLKHENKKEKIKQKSAKQVEAEKLQEAAEELKKKNISSIYKQLAKLFHPDLEQDEERKVEKMLLMQELTAAYEAKNLHALLRLELKWIHKENDHLESLTEEKLSIYLQILKEQIGDLTEQKISIIYQPQYRVLVEEFGLRIHESPTTFINQEIFETSLLIEQLKTNATLFKSDNALKHVKTLIKLWKEEQEEYDDDDWF